MVPGDRQTDGIFPLWSIALNIGITALKSLTRWREDLTTDAWGSFCYLRALDSGLVWSPAYLP